MNDIQRLVEEKKYEDALEILIGLFKDSPEDLGLLNDIATILYMAGDYEDAEKYFVLLYERDKNLDNTFNLILTRFKLGKYDEVVNLARDYIKIDSNNMEIYDILGDAYFYLQDYSNSVSCYEKTLEFGQNEISLGKLHLAQKNLDDLDKEKSRLNKWAGKFYEISRYGPENRKTYVLNYPFLFKDQALEIKLTDIFLKYKFHYLNQCKVLDVGCGEGRFLRKLLDWGADPEKLFGIDLHPGAIELAKELSSPNISFSVQHADKLSYEDGQFDIIFLIGVIQHVLDEKLQVLIANELKRVLSRRGIIITLNINKSGMNKFSATELNDTTVGIDSADLERLFPGYRVEFEDIMLTDSILFHRLPQEWSSLLMKALDPMSKDHDYGIAVISR